MPQVTVTIAGKTYRMACDEGQEDHLYNLASRLDNLVSDIRRSFGEIGDQRLIVMSAITVLDQLAESERRCRKLEDEVIEMKEGREMLVRRQGDDEARLAARVGEVADRLDAIAAKLG